MLTKRYLTSTTNLPKIMAKAVEGTAPEKFTREHLKGIGFGGSNDRAVIPLLKDLGFLAADGTPTARYHAYRDQSRSKEVMAEALIEAYKDVFTINETPTQRDRQVIEGKFKSAHNVTDRVAQLQAMTFFALLKLADLQAARGTSPRPPSTAKKPKQQEVPEAETPPSPDTRHKSTPLDLRYNIEVHLPATKDVEVYNAIFKALREHLLVD